MLQSDRGSTEEAHLCFRVAAESGHHQWPACAMRGDAPMLHGD